MDNPAPFMDRITIVHGDITQQPVEAVVNPANSSLLGGGGVDGAIHKAAGLELYEECKKLKGCATGEAKLTHGFGLRAKWVIHTVGPIWKNGTRSEEEKLAKCYRSCFELVEQNGIATVAFPAISTGAYGFPMESAARIALTETARFLQKNQRVERVFLVCFTRNNYEIYMQAINDTVVPTAKV